MKVRKQRKEVLVFDVVEKALQENQRKWNNVLSSSRKKKIKEGDGSRTARYTSN